MPKRRIKVKEVTVSLSGVIPVAAYENLRPGYSMTVELTAGESAYETMLYCQEHLRKMMKEETRRSKAEYIEKQYSSFRFYDIDGGKYVSVTTILGFDKNWYGITEDQLRQYASRGNIVEALIQHWFETKEWVDPRTIPSLAEDVMILEHGSMGFSWDDCSHKAFIEQFADKIQPQQWQKTVCNKEHQYAGTPDIVGLYDGKRSVLDIKSGGHDMRQLAAYAACMEDIEQIVVLPVGPTQNKCGYMKPVVCKTIKTEFEEFLKARAKFMRQFGI